MGVFGPTSGWLLSLLVALALAAIAGTVWGWDRGRARAVRRWVGLVLAQLLLLVALFVVVNRQIQFYASWDELFGAPATRLIEVASVVRAMSG